jgi:hypothetical protein
MYDAGMRLLMLGLAMENQKGERATAGSNWGGVTTRLGKYRTMA